METPLPQHVVEFEGELRCRNCDNSVDENGEWIDDDQYYGEDPEECPECGALLKRIR